MGCPPFFPISSVVDLPQSSTRLPEVPHEDSFEIIASLKSGIVPRLRADPILMWIENTSSDNSARRCRRIRSFEVNLTPHITQAVSVAARASCLLGLNRLHLLARGRSGMKSQLVQITHLIKNWGVGRTTMKACMKLVGKRVVVTTFVAIVLVGASTTSYALLIETRSYARAVFKVSNQVDRRGSCARRRNRFHFLRERRSAASAQFRCTHSHPAGRTIGGQLPSPADGNERFLASFKKRALALLVCGHAGTSAKF